MAYWIVKAILSPVLRLLFKVKVVSQEEYDAQMQLLRDKGQTGTIGVDYNLNQNLPGNGASEGVNR